MKRVRPGWYLPRLTRSKPRCVFRVGPGVHRPKVLEHVAEIVPGTYVYYGTGGGRHRFCLEKTFRDWITKTAAHRGRKELKCLELGPTPSQDPPPPQ